MIDFEAAETEQVTIELRYQPAYTLWDESGKIWTRLRDRFPDLKMNAALPQQQVFESTQLRMAIELEAFRVTARNPKAEVSAAEAAQEMLEICSKYLRLAAFSRVGFRVVRLIAMPTLQEATTKALELLPNHLPEPIAETASVKAFNALLRHETDSQGLLASVRGEERRIQINLPWEMSPRLSSALTKQLENEYVIIFDSDYYTVGTTERESLNIKEWARLADRYIRRYWKGVLKV